VCVCVCERFECTYIHSCFLIFFPKIFNKNLHTTIFYLSYTFFKIQNTHTQREREREREIAIKRSKEKVIINASRLTRILFYALIASAVFEEPEETSKHSETEVTSSVYNTNLIRPIRSWNTRDRLESTSAERDITQCRAQKGGMHPRSHAHRAFLPKPTGSLPPAPLQPVLQS